MPQVNNLFVYIPEISIETLNLLKYDAPIQSYSKNKNKKKTFFKGL